MRNHLWRIDGTLEDGDAAHAHAMHPLEIELDAFRGDVAVHPVPPHAGARFVGGIEKAAQQEVGLRSGAGFGSAAGLRRGRNLREKWTDDARSQKE